MYFESKEALAAYFWENPDLKSLELGYCGGITSLPELPSSLRCLLLYSCPAASRGCRRVSSRSSSSERSGGTPTYCSLAGVRQPLSTTWPRRQRCACTC